MKTLCSSNDSSTYRKPNFLFENPIFPKENTKQPVFNTIFHKEIRKPTENPKETANFTKENEFFKPVDFDFLTDSQKKSFHYDFKIFSQKEDPSIFTKEFPRNSKSFSYSCLKINSENKQINLGVDPFASSVKAFNPEASYENSMMQNENIGKINIPKKKSFHFINKFSEKDKENSTVEQFEEASVFEKIEEFEEILPLEKFEETINVNKIAMGTSITEFGGFFPLSFKKIHLFFVKRKRFFV